MNQTTSDHAQQQQQRKNLFDYTEEQLLQEHVLTHYEILNCSEYATQDDIKKAYRKCSLRYHPDKTGRGTDDYVFLAVKAAHDVLFDPIKRQAYDSTTVPFDDSIPQSRSVLMESLLYQDEDFFETFGPVFLRNLRFDARLREDLRNKNTTPSSNKRGKGKQTSASRKVKPPELGAADTPLEQVHQFYEYWIHFESWRDFSDQAASELEVENELENAESRYEKRWIQKEIDKRAKQLKKQEMGRIQTLVERAMEADPRLRKERQEQQQRKEELKRQRELEVQRRKEEAAEKERRRIEEEEKEKQRKIEEKLQREKDKKQLRKARQQLRKMASASFEEAQPTSSEGQLWDDAYDMNKDIEFLCTSLSFVELTGFNESVDSKAAREALQLIRQKVNAVRKAEQEEDEGRKMTLSSQQQEEKETNGNGKASIARSWTKEELSALAKAVKKYPPGGSSRWEQISLFVNNICKQDEPRTKEECIEKYNNATRIRASPDTKTESKADAPPLDTDTDIWTAEQDQQLQDALKEFPASLDKNERWTSISKAVSGKTKKQCVQRFKAIREALMAGRK